MNSTKTPQFTVQCRKRNRDREKREGREKRRKRKGGKLPSHRTLGAAPPREYPLAVQSYVSTGTSSVAAFALFR